MMDIQERSGQGELESKMRLRNPRYLWATLTGGRVGACRWQDKKHWRLLDRTELNPDGGYRTTCRKNRSPSLFGFWSLLTACAPHRIIPWSCLDRGRELLAIKEAERCPLLVG